ncbi:MAG: DUF397 domain-containing protein [Actinocatenispora sp.]
MAAGDLFTAAELAAVAWRTSTRSGSAGGGNCVEVGVMWRTSTRSANGGGGNCVEVGTADGSRVLVRDSKDRDGAVLSFSPAAWSGFTTSLAATD